MKKLLFIVIVVMAALSSAAESLTGNALIMRSSVQDYIRSEGYVPRIDEDGDIEFKYEGERYFISFENYDGMVYVKTYYLMSITDCNIAEVRRAADIAQMGYRFVRCNVGDSAVSIQVVLPIKTVSQYKDMFSNIMEIIPLATQKMVEAYSK